MARRKASLSQTGGWHFLSDIFLAAIALLARSILPGIAVHAIGLLAFFAVIWPTDYLRHPAPLGSGFFGALSVLALVRLARASASERAGMEAKSA
ncbi:MAG TPA: hypothetical protein VKF14_09125 [Candidatus Dormibacteraeota bacterium]|nr:hypothetical protein [Candidatus Dormibacteraeota bacterium]